MNAFYPSAPLSELLMRGTLIFLLVMVLVRILPKRAIGNNSPSDMLALITVGALVADAMSVGSDSPIDFLILAAVVSAWDWVINALEYRFPWFTRFTTEAPSVIVRDGKMLYRAMRRELITDTELMASIRATGLRHVADVALATVETTGAISIIPVNTGATKLGS